MCIVSTVYGTTIQKLDCFDFRLQNVASMNKCLKDGWLVCKTTECKKETEIRMHIIKNKNT